MAIDNMTARFLVGEKAESAPLKALGKWQFSGFQVVPHCSKEPNRSHARWATVEKKKRAKSIPTRRRSEEPCKTWRRSVVHNKQNRTCLLCSCLQCGCVASEARCPFCSGKPKENPNLVPYLGVSFFRGFPTSCGFLGFPKKPPKKTRDTPIWTQRTSPSTALRNGK